MATTGHTGPSLEKLAAHTEHSLELVKHSEQLMTEAVANDNELDRFMAQSGYTVDEMREAMLAA